MPGTMLSISVETFGALALTCLVIELTPGPNMAYLAVLSAGNSRWAGFAATLGIALGLFRDSAPAVARASISVVQW
jgi:threonine/homoserine/homoserine lactone efflux protein